MKTDRELRASFNKSERDRKKVVKSWNNSNHRKERKENGKENQESKV